MNNQSPAANSGFASGRVTYFGSLTELMMKIDGTANSGLVTQRLYCEIRTGCSSDQGLCRSSVLYSKNHPDTQPEAFNYLFQLIESHSFLPSPLRDNYTFKYKARLDLQNK